MSLMKSVMACVAIDIDFAKHNCRSVLIQHWKVSKMSCAKQMPYCVSVAYCNVTLNICTKEFLVNKL